MLWLAHAVTLARLPIAVAFGFAYGMTGVALALVGLAALTDVVDGNLARLLQRRGHTRPDIGGWLDPAVDKLFVAITLGVIWWHTRDVLVIALIGARELALIPIAHRFAGRVGTLHADWLGKLATIAQFIALAIAISLPSAALPAAIGCGALGLAAAIHYAQMRSVPSS